MKNSKLNRLLSLFLVIVMLISSSAYIVAADDDTAESPQAKGNPPEGAQIEDVFSEWAYWDIFMAQAVYGLGNEGTYSNFRGNFVWMKMVPVIASLHESFGIDTPWAPRDDVNAYVTRGETVSELYWVIAAALEIEEPGEAIDYFIENGLIKGRAKGDYQLDAMCTTEEMIIFSVRVYEHISYALKLDSKGLLWKITGKDMPNTVYLLGSIHMSDSSIYPFSKSMLKAFANSAYLGVEANIYTISEEDINYMNEIQMITDGRTIKDFISEETYALYVEVVKSLGIPAKIYDYIKPWVASNLLVEAMYTEGGEVSGALGIDMHFLMKAFTEGKEIVEVESIKYQMDMFESFSPELQEFLLLDALMAMTGGYIEEPSEEDAIDGESEEAEDTAVSENEAAEELANAAQEFLFIMLNAFKKGDEAILTEIFESSKVAPVKILEEYMDKLWHIRDAAMAKTIEQYLATEDAEGDYFVIVGAGHTVGKTGIVQVLIDAGYKVERIK